MLDFLNHELKVRSGKVLGLLDFNLHHLAIYAVGFIERGMNAPAEARQDYQLDVFVFQKGCLVWFVGFGFVVEPVGEGIRVHASAGALVDAVLKEHRGGVGGDGDGLFPDEGGLGGHDEFL
ncbi:MAG: hypothetical protein WA997_18785 [Anaerolineales bacterium]